MAVDACTNEIPVGFFKSIPLYDIGGFYEHVNTLTKQQKVFPSLLNDWFQAPSNDIIVVSGSPGSGKTFTVIETLMYVDTQILKMAYTAKTACSIGGSTIHSTLHLKWDESSFLYNLISDIQKINDEDEDYKTKCLNLSKMLQDHLACMYHPRIIVIDEVGMISFWLTNEIVKYFFTQSTDPKLIIMMGDEFQLKPVDCKYNIFNIKTFPFKMMQLSDNKRFTPDYNVIINQLKDLMRQKNEDDFFAYISATFPILENAYDYHLKECNRVLVYTNETAKKYNNFYIEQLPGPRILFPKIKNGHVLHPNDFITLKKNCDIVVTRNCIVPNGTFLKFIEYDNIHDLLVCQNPNENTKVSLSRDFYSKNFPIAVGFATTIHKFQGQTINEPKILIEFDQSRDMHLIYTALSRVRSMDQIIGVVL